MAKVARSNKEIMTDLDAMATLLLDPSKDAGGREAVATLMREAADRLLMMNVTGGIADVIFERERQVQQEKLTAEHDDGHTGGQLAAAAATYLLPLIGVRHMEFMQPFEMQEAARTGEKLVPITWPWEAEWWRPGDIDSPEDRRRRMVKGAALALAEIDRMDRDAARRKVEGK